eukprot:scaffold127738_cov30-Tisochrysis_lutea.AAC.2
MDGSFEVNGAATDASPTRTIGIEPPSLSSYSTRERATSWKPRLDESPKEEGTRPDGETPCFCARRWRSATSSDCMRLNAHHADPMTKVM